MLNTSDILETIRMIQDECLDIRTITMGISLLDCCSEDMDTLCTRVYDKITRRAEKLVATGQQIETEYGIPIINKRISITPAAMLIAATRGGDPVKLARALQRAAETTGVNFIGGELRRFADNLAHELHGVHIDAGFGRTDIDRGADVRSFSECLRDRADECLIAGGEALVDEGRETADKIDAGGLSGTL